MWGIRQGTGPSLSTAREGTGYFSDQIERVTGETLRDEIGDEHKHKRESNKYLHIKERNSSHLIFTNKEIWPQH